MIHFHESFVATFEMVFRFLRSTCTPGEHSVLPIRWLVNGVPDARWISAIPEKAGSSTFQLEISNAPGTIRSFEIELLQLEFRQTASREKSAPNGHSEWPLRTAGKPLNNSFDC